MNEKPFAGVLFASDYDHTLSAPDGTVPEANRAGIRRFIDAGGRFCIASGRS
ncbi:HAD family hydrolase, partial [Intestinimonas massiliensis (ex Afouda et al. 2020)]